MKNINVFTIPKIIPKKIRYTIRYSAIIFVTSISLLLSSLSFSLPVYCAEWSFLDKSEWVLYNFGNILSNAIGIIVPNANQLYNSTVSAIRGLPVLEESGVTAEEWLISQLGLASATQKPSSTNNIDINISNDLLNVLQTVVDDYVDDSGYKVMYSYDVNNPSLLSSFQSGTLYNYFKSSVMDNNFGIKNVFNTSSRSFFISTTSVMLNDDIAFVDYTRGDFHMYHLYNWQRYTPSEVGYTQLTYDSTIDTVTANLSTLSNLQDFQLSSVDISPGSPPVTTSNTYFFITNGIQPFLVFDTLADLQSYSVGMPSYYVTNSYDSSKTWTDSFNTTTQNIDKSITYGDVTDYVNNYYTENNNSYPSYTTINNYINNYEPSGGGGDDDSGGGSGGDDDSGGGNIFDWLGSLGEILGGLISNVGEVLVGVVQGIADLFNSLVGLLPTVFSDFLAALFAWLPEDLRAVISLSIVAMCLVGLIRLLKG